MSIQYVTGGEPECTISTGGNSDFEPDEVIIMNSPAFDDETIDLSDDEYTAPGHDNALSMPMALVPSALCEHTFELQSMRNALEQLRAENDNLRAERDSLRTQLELETEND